MFLGKGLAAVVIKCGAAGLSFAMFVALAQVMEQDAFGLFGFAFALATLLAVLGSIGQRNLVLRFASIYSQNDNIRAAITVTGRGLLHVLFGTGLIALLIVATSFWPFQSHRALLQATACLTLCIALAEFFPSPLRATGSVFRALVPRDIASRLLMICLAAGVFWTGTGPLTATEVLWSMCLCLAVCTLLQAFSHRATHPKYMLETIGDASESQAWRDAMPGFWGNSVVNAAGRNLVVVAVAFLLPAATVGAFFAALRTAMVLELLLMAMNIVAAPLLAGHLSRGDMANAQAVCRSICIVICGPTLFVLAICIGGGGALLSLFGSDYASAAPELAILAMGYAISALAGPTMQIMEMGGHERTYFRMLLFTTLAGLIALPMAIALFGSLGAALCIAGSMAALNVCASAFIHQQMGIAAGVTCFWSSSKTRKVSL